MALDPSCGYRDEACRKEYCVMAGQYILKTFTEIGEADMCQLTYVLVTPARNEAAFIEMTIRCVTQQTILPKKWVIVSDGSDDATDDIVSRYAAENGWIELVRVPYRRDRHFAGKVHAFNTGYARLTGVDYDVIGNLDADVSFDAEYFSFLLGKLRENPRLGVCGTPFREGFHQYDYRFTSIEHVSGACQLFRRECFEAVGGYLPLKEGGVDLAAVLTARMLGWETRSFLEKTYEHHKKTQAGGHATAKALFKSGYHDYLMGTHPVWQIARSIYRTMETPILIGGALLLAGYLSALLKRAEPIVSRDLQVFRRNEQMRRLKAFFLKSWLCRTPAAN
jgi:biofilm PGA synthesis N-glycosyltransferase PgaC